MLGFLPSTKDVHMRLTGMSQLCQCECVGDVCALQWKGVLSRFGACLCLELLGVALSPLDDELKMIFWKIILLVFINLS